MRGFVMLAVDIKQTVGNFPPCRDSFRAVPRYGRKQGTAQKMEVVMRYFLSVIGVVITFLLLCFCGGNGWEYLASMADVISMLSILLIVIPILISSGLHRDFIHAFPLALGKAEGKSLRQLKRAKEAVDLAIRAMVQN